MKEKKYKLGISMNKKAISIGEIKLDGSIELISTQLVENYDTELSILKKYLNIEVINHK